MTLPSDYWEWSSFTYQTDYMNSSIASLIREQPPVCRSYLFSNPPTDLHAFRLKLSLIFPTICPSLLLLFYQRDFKQVIRTFVLFCSEPSNSFVLPCQPMEYGKEISNRLSYLVSSRFMMSARPGERRRRRWVGREGDIVC